MRLKSWASNLALALAWCLGVGLVSGVHVHTQSPFLVFGSNSGTAQPVNATANALWVSIQASSVVGTPLLIGASDTGISRTAAATIAFGNGTQADTSGGLAYTLGQMTATAFASLGTPANGTYKYCNDCTVTTAATCPATKSSCVCAGSGNGALAVRLNGTWDCALFQ